jgi:hypothetical protein
MKQDYQTNTIDGAATFERMYGERSNFKEGIITNLNFKTMSKSFNMKLCCKTVTVIGNYIPDTKQTLEYPGDQEDFEIESVEYEGVDIYDFLSDNYLDEIKSHFFNS